MATDLLVYAADAVATAKLEFAHDRLADLLASGDPLRLGPAVLRALADGRKVDLPDLELERNEVLVAVPDTRRGNPGRRIGTVSRPAVLRVGPYEVLGHLHGPPSTDPLILARRKAWVAITAVSIRYTLKGRVLTDLHATALVNSQWIDSIAPSDDATVESRRQSANPLSGGFGSGPGSRG